MKEVGINTVRIAEFAWSRLETEENHFDFVWLDEIIDILAEGRIQVPDSPSSRGFNKGIWSIKIMA